MAEEKILTASELSEQEQIRREKLKGLMESGNNPYQIMKYDVTHMSQDVIANYEQLKERADYQAWLTGDNEANVPPDGESGQQMTERVLAAFGELQTDTCIVTHGGGSAAIMAARFPEEGRHRYLWQPKNGCGYAITEDSFEPIP